jgi:hypothetical protein
MYDAYQKLRLTQEFIVFPRKDHWIRRARHLGIIM